MSTQLALRYLAKFGIKLKFTTDGSWQLGKTVFKPLEAHTGGYQNIDAWGHQILLNYRSHRSITEIAPQITLGEVLAGQLNAEAVKDRIVIIGTTAASFKDFSLTPYKTQLGEAQNISGVILQAQAVSQIISAALDGYCCFGFCHTGEKQFGFWFGRSRVVFWDCCQNSSYGEPLL